MELWDSIGSVVVELEIELRVEVVIAGIMYTFLSL